MPFALKMVGLRLLSRLSGGSKEKLNDDLERRMRLVLEHAIGASRTHIQGRRATNPDDLLGIVTEELRKRIGGARVIRKGDSIIGTYGPQAVVYAAVHEFGWPERNIRARPYLQTGLDDVSDFIEKELGDAFSASVLR